MRNSLVVLILCLMSQGALADVVAAGSGGFSLRIETASKASVDESYDAFLEIGRWWDPAHSYSGDAANMSLDISPGGVFLEKLDSGGFVKHLELVYLNPGKEIRFLGGLGPLQPMGLHGAMTVQFEATDSGSKTIMLYNVSGFSAQGLEMLAPIVDKVQAGQMARHAAYAESR